MPAFGCAQEERIPMSSHKIMAKKPRLCREIEMFQFLSINLLPIIGFSCFVAQMIAVKVGHRMIFGFTESDRIQESQTVIVYKFCCK